MLDLGRPAAHLPMADDSTRHELARIQPRQTAAVADDPPQTRAERKAVAVPVKLTVKSATDAVLGRTVNISRTGMFIATSFPPSVGTTLDVEIELPDNKLLFHARGEVVRHGEANGVAGVGVCFIEISYESRELMDELLGVEAETALLARTRGQ